MQDKYAKRVKKVLELLEQNSSIFGLLLRAENRNKLNYKSIEALIHLCIEVDKQTIRALIKEQQNPRVLLKAKNKLSRYMCYELSFIRDPEFKKAVVNTAVKEALRLWDITNGGKK